ncbi:MAG: fasciclin domain-containing protein [Paludibacter sp.]|jgi:uncharacterized surface protein with fasciclin (FAS1) repeats|nr:fasciclin domain-containing protein [Paludibacter sp.]
MFKKIVNKIFWLMILPLLFVGCEDKMQEHYKVPDWLKGSAWQVLEKDGNYSVFLRGVELAGFRPMMEGKSILTVMAPNDASFKQYLTTHGYSDISEMSVSEVKKLIGFHLLYYSYNKEKMVNFRPEGDQMPDEYKLINAGLYYKFRTRSQDAPTTAIDTLGQSITIYHLERFLPVFSYNFFNTKGIDAKANYEYFYPNSTWTGDNGFNASNATVTEYQIIADNGYIYTIDRVLEPLGTIYDELRSNHNYSEFFALYDSYTEYVLDDELTANYKEALGVTALYQHTHSGLPSIALEWPTSNQLSISTLASISYSIFAPTNDALSDFYNRYWQPGGYLSLADVDKLVMNALLLQFTYNGSIVFPQEIAQGKINNYFGVPFNFDPYATADKKICINGAFYGLSEFVTPPLFGSVIGPAFKYKNSSAFLYVLLGAGNSDASLNIYASKNTNYVMLIPTNEQFAINSITLEDAVFGDPSKGKVLKELNNDGELVNVSQSHSADIANLHANDHENVLQMSGTKVYETKTTFNYWFVKDGKITNNTFFNQLIEPTYTGNPWATLTEITNEGGAWSNGRAYRYDSPNGIFTQETGDLNYNLAINSDDRYPYYEFVKLLKMAGMILGQTVPMLANGRFAAFIPTNDVIKQAWIDKKLPGLENCSSSLDWDDDGIDKDIPRLAEYLQNYFVRSMENTITNYPYFGSSFRSGNYRLLNGNMLEYTDNGSVLSVKVQGSANPAANVVPTYDYFPFVYKDGCFHLIDKVL